MAFSATCGAFLPRRANSSDAVTPNSTAAPKVTPEQMQQAVERQSADQRSPGVVAPCPRKTWIVVRLLDAEGNPVKNRKYIIKAPDGHVERGKLDASGSARLEGLDPGTCMVTFPELDGNAWERI